MVACLMEFERHAGLIGFMKKGEPLWGSCFMAGALGLELDLGSNWIRGLSWS